MSEQRQCMNFDMRNKQCIHVTGHSRDHEYQASNEDRSEDIRLRFAQDVRDRRILLLESLLRDACDQLDANTSIEWRRAQRDRISVAAKGAP